MNNTVRIAVATLILTGCATMPQQDTALENARAEVDSLSQQPLAQQAAADDLKNARKYLQDGDSALQQHLPLAVVDHDAYLASRSAQAGQARVEEAQARAQITQAQNERQAILLHSRAQEAQQAKDQADLAKQQADAARQQADNARLQADAAKDQLAQTQQQLADLQAKKTDRGMVLTLGDVLFDTGQANLKPGAANIMDRVAAFMNDNPQVNVRIEGHTDSTGAPDFNQVLSQNRAESAAAALQTRGVSSNRITAVGKGPELPVATNATSAGRQQNRRVEIVFSDNSGQFARAN